jgi:hypothetical protein
MISEEILKRLESLEGDDKLAVGKALSDFKAGFQKLFNTIIDGGLTHDEMLQVAETQLDEVYDEFMGAGEIFHGENPDTDDLFGRSVEFPD